MKTFSKDCGAALCRYKLNGKTMGTQYSAVFFADAKLDKALIDARLFAAVDSVDRQMSSWRPDTDLNRLNRAPANEWLSIPPQLFEVLSTALRVARASHDAFDIGVGELVHAWGFGPGNGRVDEARIKALRAEPHRAATEVLELDQAGRRVRKLAAITLDLSGIAKGYGVDQLASCLDGLGISDYLVGIDGEMRARGEKPGGRPWTVAIEKPVRHVREVMGVMELGDGAIATSGDYRHWVDFQGRSYSHTIDGSLRQPSLNQLAAVSVVASTCMLADAWATALLVLGERAGRELAQQRGMDALFVLHDGDGFRQVWVTEGQLIGEAPSPAPCAHEAL